MKLESIKEGVSSFLDSVADGWHHLRESATNAMTRFRPGEASGLPDRETVDDPFYVSAYGWSMLSGEVFEDDQRLIVRVEVPGMDKKDMSIEVLDDKLVLSGEKRFSEESSDGRWRIIQCAYGSFHRTVPLPVPVLADQARATYKNGILRVELPKADPGSPKAKTIEID